MAVDHVAAGFDNCSLDMFAIMAVATASANKSRSAAQNPPRRKTRKRAQDIRRPFFVNGHRVEHVALSVGFPGLARIYPLPVAGFKV